jgi:hypothetical protein
MWAASKPPETKAMLHVLRLFRARKRGWPMEELPEAAALVALSKAESSAAATVSKALLTNF